MNQQEGLEALKMWLDNAHAMELSIADVLEKQLDDTEDYPAIHNRLEQHLRETNQHARLVEARLRDLGEEPSKLKAGIANMMGKAEGAMMGMGKYKLTQHAIGDYAAEHFEIANYKAIMELARQLEDSETMLMCEEILADEVEMAQWLDSQLPVTVQAIVVQPAKQR